MVVIDIIVGDDNAREILRRTGIYHGFTAPIGFVNGVCIFWESSKMFLVPHKFEDTHATFMVKVSVDNFVHVTYANFVAIVCNTTRKQCTCTTFDAYVSNFIVNWCREFDNDVKSTGINVARLLPCSSLPYIISIGTCSCSKHYPM